MTLKLRIKKNNKNPFVQVEAMPLMVWTCPFSCEQAPRQKATSTPSIPMGFQPEQKKNQENHFSSKGHDGLSIHIVLVFLTLVFHRSGIIHYIYMGISQRTSLD